MKFAVVVLCLVGFALAADKYENIDENFNLSELLGNDRLLQAYAKCLVNKGPCTSEVKKVKEKIPEVLETRCAKCTDKQKEMGKVLIQQVKNKHPELWTQLVAMYDPDGKYQEVFQDYIKN